MARARGSVREQAAGPGRTGRPGLEQRFEEHNPPSDARVCRGCASPYRANGAKESALVEIEVRAYRRVIRRPRWRQTCGCASSPFGSVGAPRAPPVRPHALRDERLVTLPVRALHLPAPPAPGQRLAVRPRGGDPRAPERLVAAPRRRDQPAGAGAAGQRRIGVRLAVDLGRPRRGLLPCGSAEDTLTTGPAATTPLLSSSKPSSRSPALPEASTGPPVGSASAPHPDAAATTPPSCTPSPPRMSGSLSFTTQKSP